MSKSWKKIKPIQNGNFNKYSGILESVLLENREIFNDDDAKKFFNPSFDNLESPFVMKDMKKAVMRIEKALKNKEHIMVYGDYDVDGTTSVSLIYNYFKNYHSNITYYIPDRYTEGYGVSIQGIDYAKSQEVTLMIILDCGIKALKQIEHANYLGIDAIICDHHRPGETVPKAVAILNPKQVDCPYPYKEFSGCGIGLRLAQAYAEHMKLDARLANQGLDLAATSIAADIVPITGENRVFAHFGLIKVNKKPSYGLNALLQIAGQTNPISSIEDLVFKVSPRINAAGRMIHASKAVDLLTSVDNITAKAIASEINDLNTSRKDVDSSITTEALDILKKEKYYDKKKSTVIAKADWHKGVIGIVASRLIEQYYRPTIVFTILNGSATGSARSVKGFDIYAAIHECDDLIENWGGHTFAAGLTIKTENLEKFKVRFEEVVAKSISQAQQIETLLYDEELTLDLIDSKLINDLKKFEPHGPGNMKPLFISKNVQVPPKGAKSIGTDKAHLKFKVVQNDIEIDCIAFGLGNMADEIMNAKGIDICYTIEENHWNNTITTQLNVKDIKLAPDERTSS
ncbi:MAG: single-stranded-DNA-specific exonuclease [Sphingobacteriales bacterium]|jgi:single-stranded-DNA-specific exonuclease